ncbi:MAG: hypothetical protein CMJ34_13385 [Phycisphaerae bacterium]|nr:hypothetical protein [Phycisphaerae bacterium]
MRRPSDTAFLEEVAARLRDAASELPLSALEGVVDTTHPIAQRVLRSVSLDGGQHAQRDALLARIEELLTCSEHALLRRAFDLHDLDGNGTLQEAEVQEILTDSLRGYKVMLTTRELEQLSHTLFSRCDRDQNGVITLDELASVLAPYPALRDQMARTAITCLQPRRAGSTPSSGISTLERLRPVINNHPLLLVVGLVYLLVNGLLFWQAASHYAALGSNLSIQIARGSAACIHFNGALILLPVMRHFVSWIRNTRLRHLLPVDQNLSLHRLLGHVLFGLGLVHTGAHLHNYSTLSQALMASLTTTQAGITGLLLLGCFMVMWVCALDFVRSRGAFEVFFLSHLLFVAWFGLMLFHSPVFWKWMLVPGAMFLVETIVRHRRRNPEVPVVSTMALSSGVTRLTIARPKELTYSAGDYLFVRDPRLARHEWHPFTITSCPENQDTVELHIRSRGNWTRRLHELAQSEAGQPDEPALVCLDGPYGTPSAHIYASTNVVLIGAGIGVTPFISILQSMHAQRQGVGKSTMPLKRVHFLWLNRTHRAFEWFTDLLVALESDNADGFLDIGIYLTGVKDSDRVSMLDIAMLFHHEQTGRDLLTGLGHRTTLGRPDWEALFADWRTEHQGESVDVYFCGPLALGRALRQQAFDSGFGFHMERF